MQPDTAVTRPAGRVGPYAIHQKRMAAPTRVFVEQRMVTTLCRHVIDLGDHDAAVALLRRAGFHQGDIASHANQAIAVAQARTGRR